MDRVEERFRKSMHDLATHLDLALNDGVRPRKYGFGVVMFEFGNTTRLNWITNTQAAEMIKVLRNMADKLEKKET